MVKFYSLSFSDFNSTVMRFFGLKNKFSIKMFDSKLLIIWTVIVRFAEFVYFFDSKRFGFEMMTDFVWKQRLLAQNRFI